MINYPSNFKFELFFGDMFRELKKNPPNTFKTF